MTVDLARTHVKKIDTEWRVWLPPTRPEHTEGGAILAPYGDTYWPTWEEAWIFLAAVGRDEEAQR